LWLQRYLKLVNPNHHPICAIHRKRLPPPHPRFTYQCAIPGLASGGASFTHAHHLGFFCGRRHAPCSELMSHLLSQKQS
jgi:hypothetical protein